MTVRLHDAAFDPCREFSAYQEGLGESGKFGAAVSFIGTMRDFNEGHAVQAMTLEHYPGMTEKQLERVCDEARQRWNIRDALIVHRVGTVRPNDPIVLVAVWAVHRGAAFDACRFLIEALKTRAPFWKKEQRAEYTRWVEHNTPAIPSNHS